MRGIIEEAASAAVVPRNVLRDRAVCCMVLLARVWLDVYTAEP